MNNALERRLAAVIEDQIRDLPEPPAALFDTITRGAVRRRRRTRVTRAGAVCAGVLALVGTVALVPVLRAGPGPTTVGTPSASASASPNASASASASATGSAAPGRTTGIVPPASADRLPDFGTAKPIAQVWPDAIVNLPMTVNGTFIQPRAILPGNRYVVAGGGAANGALRIYDASTRKLTTIEDGSGIGGGEVVGIAGDRVVSVSPGLDLVSEIRATRLDGGGTTVLARPQAPIGIKVNIASVTRDSVVWSLLARETGRYVGLYRVPVTGGTVERIAGGEGFTASWHIPGVVNTVHTWADGPTTGQVWDLTTGERAAYTRNPRMATMVCVNLDWCGGRSVDNHPAVQRFDGSGFVELQGEGSVAALPGGRFARITYDTKHPVVPDARMTTGAVLWDLKTGQVGSADPVGAGGHDGIISYRVGGSFATWEIGDTAYVLLDFQRIR
jgi:hypothetical protein